MTKAISLSVIASVAVLVSARVRPCKRSKAP